jgi:hypothetical protein
MPARLRIVPWLLALVGLGVPLVGSGFTLWMPVLAWLAGLSLLWVVGRGVTSTRRQRLGSAVLLLPLLLLSGYEGGWWLIPADAAWIVIEWTSDDERSALAAPDEAPP